MTEARTPRGSAVRFLPLLGRYLGPQRARTALLGTLLLLSIGLQLANPLNLRAFLDAATTGAGADRLLNLALLFFGLACLQQLAALATAYIGEDLGWRATNRMRADLAGHLLRLDMSFHNARTPGELIERIDGDITALANFFSHFVVQVIGNSLLLVGVLVLLFAEDWRIGAALAAFVAVTIVALMRVRTLGTPHWRAQRQASAELLGFLEERIGGTEDIRANGARPYVLARFERLQAALGRKELAAGLVTSTLINTGWVLFAVGNALAFMLSAWLFERGELTVGVAYLVFYYTNLIVRPIERLMNELEDFQRALASIGRVESLFQLRSRLVDGQHTLPSGPLEVAFDHVSFGYRDEPSAAERRKQELEPRSAGAPLQELDLTPAVLVLHDVSLRVAPGRVLGLLGRTGSGKTTISRLLARMYDPTQGAVRLAGQALPSLSLAGLRQRVGVVTQNVQLFHASVRDNLTLFRRGVPDDRICAVLADLGLGDWLGGLPHGLDTLLAPAGSGLSAGQAQLLAFARIFLQQPGLVILDEASSRLDPATEQYIEHALDRLLRDPRSPRTAIIIAHRLATVQRADDILILEAGRIAEYGAREALAADPGSRFAQLLRTGLAEVLE
jgi:ABC-type multidrug transport system fused ATPase/permease subunit